MSTPKIQICMCDDPDCKATKINYAAMRAVRKLARQGVSTNRICLNIRKRYCISRNIMFAMLGVASDIQFQRYMMAQEVQVIEIPEEVLNAIEAVFNSHVQQPSHPTVH